MLTEAQRRWGIDQWSAWLRDKDIPILPASRDAIEAIDVEQADAVSPREMTAFLMADPLFALRLLRKAEQVRSRQLHHETHTMLATVMQIRTKPFRTRPRESPAANTAWIISNAFIAA